MLIIDVSPYSFAGDEYYKKSQQLERGEEALPSKVLLIPLPISPACDLGLSEPSFLRTKNPFADLMEHSQWTGLMLTQCATLGCFCWALD